MSHDILDILACCVEKARLESGYSEKPDNDVYWHTREACLEVAKRHGKSIREYVKSIYKFAREEYPDSLWSEAKEIWPEVAHPSLIVRDVHNS